MLKVILARHGETEWNKKHLLQGSRSDTPLNQTGMQQAQALAERLKDEQIKAIYSSPLQRAMYTARVIAQNHGLEVIPLPALREIDMGELEGVPSANLKMHFVEFIGQTGADQQPITLTGGESLGDVQRRAWEAIESTGTQHSAGTIVAITHYFVIVALVCQVLHLPLAQSIHLRLNPGTITTFTLEGNNNTHLDLFNEKCYIR